MKLHSQIFLSLFVAIMCQPTVSAGIFSNMLQNREMAVSSSIPSSSSIFKKHIGAANPVRWARQLPGVTNTELFLTSDAWQSTRFDFLQNYGRKPQVYQYLDCKEYLFRRAIRINNKAHFQSLDIKGNLAESVMDYFYRKDGWEVLDGKRGRNGFDGLYVRRNKNGTITEWLVAEAKSGSSKPKMTSRGMQLSQEWIDGNLTDLLDNANKEYSQTPSLTAKKRIEDLKQIMKLQGRQPRFCRMRLVTNGEKIQYKIEHFNVDGKLVNKPVFVNMNSTNSGTMLTLEHRIYKDIKNHIARYDPQRAEKLVTKIQTAFKKSRIRSDSDLYKFIKREIPNKRLAAAVTQELGDKPPRGSLAGAIGKQVSKNSGMILTATVIAGFIIAHDAMKNGITSETFFKAGVVSAATLGTGIVVDYAMKQAVMQTSKLVSRYMLEHTGKKVSEQAVARLAANLAPKIGKVFGGGLQIAFGLYFIGDAVYSYNQGNITQTNLWVNVGIIALTTAGTVFFTCTEAGAAIGTSIFPGLGTAGGTLIGMAIGVLGGVATGGYAWYVETKRQEDILFEARQLAEWEVKNNHARLAATILMLEKEAGRMHDTAWGNLLAGN